MKPRILVVEDENAIRLALKGLLTREGSEVDLSPDEELALVATSNGTVHLWDMEGNELAALVRHDAAAKSAEFSPSGDRIVTACADGSARIWLVVSAARSAVSRLAIWVVVSRET